MIGAGPLLPLAWCSSQRRGGPDLRRHGAVRGVENLPWHGGINSGHHEMAVRSRGNREWQVEARQDAMTTVTVVFGDRYVHECVTSFAD
jgi:hypothetical protein